MSEEIKCMFCGSEFDQRFECKCREDCSELNPAGCSTFSVDVYTTVDRNDHPTHDVSLIIDHQSFNIAYDPETREQAEWMAKQLTDAINKLLHNQIAQVRGTSCLER